MDGKGAEPLMTGVSGPSQSRSPCMEQDRISQQLVAVVSFYLQAVQTYGIHL